MAISKEDVTARLKNFHANMAGGSEKVDTTTIPRGLEATAPGKDQIQAKFDSFLKTVPVLKNIDPRFAEIPDITENLPAVTIDFEDDKRLEDPAVILNRAEDIDVATVGREVIPMLSSGFSETGVGALFFLAYHLRDPANENSYVLDGAYTLAQFTDMSLDELSDNIMAAGPKSEDLPDIGNLRLEAQAYAYIAASTLRLFTESEENYIREFNHILMGYQRFYGSKIPISVPPPSPEALKTLSHYFSHGAVFKGTLFRLLYIGGGTKVAEGMRKFLYELHLANTGIHIVGIFIRLCGVLDCKPGLLLTAISTAEFERQITTLVSMLNLIVNKDGAHTRKMWRYGRLFDETFMAPLQTKSCSVLAFVLASALKSVAADTNQGILNIAQLADVSAVKRRLCAASGEMIVKMIQQHNGAYTRSLPPTPIYRREFASYLESCFLV